MQTVTIITFNINDLVGNTKLKPSDQIYVRQGSLVRFEFDVRPQAKEPLSPFIVYNPRFFVKFENSPFTEQQKNFETDVLQNQDEPIVVGEGTVEKAGEYKFSIGLRDSIPNDIEIDPYLVVISSNR